MNPEQKKMLLNAGIDYHAGLSRFMGNETLWEHFLLKFVHDQSYAMLCRALSENDCAEAFRAAHTLKGVAGNLSLNLLFKEVSVQIEYLRIKDLVSARTILPRIDAAYQSVIHVLSAINLCIPTAGEYKVKNA